MIKLRKHISTLATITSTLRDAKGLVYGGDRYLKAVKAALAVERGYRRYRRKIVNASQEAKAQHLSALHRKNAEIVCAVCRKNGATWIKFAQFLSCRPDILPPEYITALQGLQNSADPILFEELRPTLEDAWGADWEARFSEFNQVPKATASVAQVHQARLATGEEVAVKIRIPQVVDRFRQDALAFRSIAILVSPLIRGLDIKHVTDQLISMTLEELDFETEAKNMLKFAKLKHIHSISVPRFYDQLSTDKILVTEWRGGKPLAEYLQAHPDQAKTVLGYPHWIGITGSYMRNFLIGFSTWFHNPYGWSRATAMITPTTRTSMCGIIWLVS